MELADFLLFPVHTDHFIDPVITFFTRSHCVLNRERVYRTLTTLDVFVDRTLCLVSKSETLSGFHYNRDMRKSAMANTYLETAGSMADSIHMAIKNLPMSHVFDEYVSTLHVLAPRTGFAEHDAVLAFDYTDYDSYGELECTWLHSWTVEHGVTGKFRFLTCSLESSDMPQRVPLLSIPVHTGYNIARDVSFCLELVQPLFKSVRLCLFLRGFYSNELMIVLDGFQLVLPQVTNVLRWNFYPLCSNPDQTMIIQATASKLPAIGMWQFLDFIFLDVLPLLAN